MAFPDGWAYRRKITITNNSDTDIDDYQLKLMFDDQTIDFSKLKPDGTDMRFTTNDGITLIPHYIEYWDSDPSVYQGEVWVKIPHLPAKSTVVIYMYYGNPKAPDTSDPEAVFDFFDDFEGDSIDTNKWVITASGNYNITVSNSVLDITTEAGNENNVYLGTKQAFSPPLIIEARHQLKNSYMTRFCLSSSQTKEEEPYIFLELTYLTRYHTKIESNDGSSTVSENLPEDITGNEWHIVGIKTDGYAHTGFWDDKTAYVKQSNDFQGYLLFRHVSAWNQSMESLTDWVRVRKYLDPEPSYMIDQYDESTINPILTTKTALSPSCILPSLSQTITLTTTIATSPIRKFHLTSTLALTNSLASSPSQAPKASCLQTITEHTGTAPSQLPSSAILLSRSLTTALDTIPTLAYAFYEAIQTTTSVSAIRSIKTITKTAIQSVASLSASILRHIHIHRTTLPALSLALRTKSAIATASQSIAKLQTKLRRALTTFFSISPAHAPSLRLTASITQRPIQPTALSPSYRFHIAKPIATGLSLAPNAILSLTASLSISATPIFQPILKPIAKPRISATSSTAYQSLRTIQTAISTTRTQSLSLSSIPHFRILTQFFSQAGLQTATSTSSTQFLSLASITSFFLTHLLHRRLILTSALTATATPISYLRSAISTTATLTAFFSPIRHFRIRSLHAQSIALATSDFQTTFQFLSQTASTTISPTAFLCLASSIALSLESAYYSTLLPTQSLFSVLTQSVLCQSASSLTTAIFHRTAQSIRAQPILTPIAAQSLSCQSTIASSSQIPFFIVQKPISTATSITPLASYHLSSLLFQATSSALAPSVKVGTYHHLFATIQFTIALSASLTCHYFCKPILHAVSALASQFDLRSAQSYATASVISLQPTHAFSFSTQFADQIRAYPTSAIRATQSLLAQTPTTIASQLSASCSIAILYTYTLTPIPSQILSISASALLLTQTLSLIPARHFHLFTTITQTEQTYAIFVSQTKQKLIPIAVLSATHPTPIFSIAKPIANYLALAPLSITTAVISCTSLVESSISASAAFTQALTIQLTTKSSPTVIVETQYICGIILRLTTSLTQIYPFLTAISSIPELTQSLTAQPTAFLTSNIAVLTTAAPQLQATVITKTTFVIAITILQSVYLTPIANLQSAFRYTLSQSIQLQDLTHPLASYFAITTSCLLLTSITTTRTAASLSIALISTPTPTSELASRIQLVRQTASAIQLTLIPTSQLAITQIEILSLSPIQPITIQSISIALQTTFQLAHAILAIGGQILAYGKEITIYTTRLLSYFQSAASKIFTFQTPGEKQ